MLDLGTGGGEFLSSLVPFDLAGYDEALRALHATMESGTPLKVNGHRFLVIARST